MYKFNCKYCGELEIKTSKHAGSHIVNCEKNPNRGKSFEKLRIIGKELALLNKEKLILEYLVNPKKCEECNNVLDYNDRNNKFCNHSCSASYSNKNRKEYKYVLTDVGYNNIVNSNRKRIGKKLSDIVGYERSIEIGKKISESLSKPKIDFICPVCNTVIKILKTQKRKYCSGTCRNKINNQLINGTRSKAEIYLECKLKEEFPKLIILFNSRKILNNNRELDVYIPEIKLAIEWNGIYHYKDIRTKEFLIETKEKDLDKIKQCKELNIELYIVKDLTSSNKFIEEETNKIIKYIKTIL